MNGTWKKREEKEKSAGDGQIASVYKLRGGS